MASPAQLVAAIRARAARAAQGGDFSAVLSAEALAEARELAAFAEGDAPAQEPTPPPAPIMSSQSPRPAAPGARPG